MHENKTFDMHANFVRGSARNAKAFLCMPKPYEKIFKNKLAIFLVIIILTKMFFLFYTPMDRYNDDIRYMAIAKTIVMNGNFLTSSEIFGDTLFYGPPLVPWVAYFTYVISFGNNEAWFFISKFVMMLFFFGSLLVFYKIIGMFDMNEKEKVIALAFFSFLPMTSFLSASVMQDMPLLFFTLLLFWSILKKNTGRKEMLLIVVSSGLLFLIKYTALFIVLAALATATIFKKDRKTKALVLASIIAGSAIVGGWWYVRNYEVFGSPFYHQYFSYTSSTSVVSEKGFLERSVKEYMSFWSLPTFSSITGKLGNIPYAGIIYLSTGIFLLPLIMLPIIGIYNNRKYWVLLPLLILLFAFTWLYNVFLLDNSRVERYFFPAMPFFSIFLAFGMRRFNNGLVNKYFVVSLVLLFLISSAVTLVVYKQETSAKNCILQISERVKDNELSIPKNDTTLRILGGIYLDRNIEYVENFSCGNKENFCGLDFCSNANKTLIFKEGILYNIY